MENPVKQADTTFMYIIGFSLALLLAVTATMTYFALRYRREKDPGAADIRGNTALELAWTVIPALIALSMLNIGWQTYLGLCGERHADMRAELRIAPEKNISNG